MQRCEEQQNITLLLGIERDHLRDVRAHVYCVRVNVRRLNGVLLSELGEEKERRYGSTDRH
jgi:hypothetical protein